MLTDIKSSILAILWAAATGNTALLTDVFENMSAPGLTLSVGPSPLTVRLPCRCDEALLARVVRHAATLGINWGRRPLSLAVYMRNTPLVRVLLERGASPNLAGGGGETPLHLAARSQQSGIARLLLANGADTSAVYFPQMTPLQVAVSAAGPLDTDVVRAILEAGANPDTRGPGGITALHLAIGIRSVPDSQAIVSMLLEHGADPTLPDQHGETALDLALLVVPYRPIMVLLIARGGPHPRLERPTVQRQDLARLMLSRMSGHLPAATARTILHTAVRCDWDDATTTLLLQRGALLDAPDPVGCTPLHSAVQSSARAVALLLAAGSDSTLRDHAGQTALHTAARMSSVGPLQLLLRHGADVTTRDNDGRTPLHVAAAYGRPKHFVVLLEHGARIGTRDGDGLVPLELAALRKAVGSRLRQRVRLVQPQLEAAGWAGSLGSQ